MHKIFFMTIFAILCLIPNLAISAILVTDTFVKTERDTVPRFANIPGAGAIPIKNARSGVFSDASAWVGGQTPGSNARVHITAGTTIEYDLNNQTKFASFEVQDGGHLKFSTHKDTTLLINELMVMPQGELSIGTASAPIASDHTATIVFRSDTPLKTGTVSSPGLDPFQFGRGLLVFGKMNIYGRQLDKTYLRFTREPLSGESTLSVEEVPVGWHIGDTLIIPDTRQIQFNTNRVYTSQAEEVVISSMSGKIISLTAPLVHDHKGPRDALGNVGPVELSMLPHVGNLSRNIVLRSEDTSTIAQRGHVQVFQRADVDIRYAAFLGLGRTTKADLHNTKADDSGNITQIGTNQVGRYSLHMHHVWGPINPSNTGYQWQMIGCTVDDMRKWGITVHNTHYGLFQWNVLYDGVGSALATEDGNEAFNVFERNFVVHTKAGDIEGTLHNVDRGGVFNQRALFGTTRDGFWFSGEHNYVRDNVVANAPGFAFNYNGYYLTATMNVPKFRGADMGNLDNVIGWNFNKSGFDPERHRREGLPVLESARNESYGATGNALWVTWGRGCCDVADYIHRVVFQDYKMWHINHTGVYAFHESRNTYEGFVMRNDPAVSSLSGPFGRFNRGFWLGTSAYENGQLIIRDFDIQGFNVGIAMPVNTQDGTPEPNISLIEHGTLKNHVNIADFFSSLIEGKTSIIRNVEFTPIMAYESNRLPSDPTNIWLDPTSTSTEGGVRPSAPADFFVYDYNGVTDHNFQLYWKTQDAPCAQVDGDDCTASRARAANLDIIGRLFLLGDSPPHDITAPLSPEGLTIHETP